MIVRQSQPLGNCIYDSACFNIIQISKNELKVKLKILVVAFPILNGSTHQAIHAKWIFPSFAFRVSSRGKLAQQRVFCSNQIKRELDCSAVTNTFVNPFERVQITPS